MMNIYHLPAAIPITGPFKAATLYHKVCQHPSRYEHGSYIVTGFLYGNKAANEGEQEQGKRMTSKCSHSQRGHSPYYCGL